MKRLKGTPQSLLLVIFMLMAGALLSTISACAVGTQTPLERVLRIIGVEDPLSAEAARELDRFARVYQEYVTDPRDIERLEYFDFAFKRLRTSYVRSVSDSALIDAAIKGVTEKEPKPGSLSPVELVEAALHSMVTSLDPHSAYLNEEQFRESFVHTTGEFGGLGIEVTMSDGLIKVVAPIEDTPAYRAGIISGDLITHVDGAAIKGKSLLEAVRRMRGAAGTDILLRVRRDGTPDFDIKITRAVIKVKAVKWRTEGNVGYIRVTRFSEKLERGIEQAFEDIDRQLGNDLAGIVLDLRNNPGGLLDQSIILSDAFLNAGEIVSVRGRSPESGRSYEAADGDIANGKPIVVLINEGSASASEIVASALKYHRRATVMGTRSFGKGSVQTIMPLLPVGGALRLTTALYYAPSGETIQARGVQPDIILKPDEVDERQRETDLPGSFPALGNGESGDQPAVSLNACPAVGEKEDRQLGCALAFLASGSTDKFLASYGGGQHM